MIAAWRYCRLWIGRVLNLAGVPGIVRDGDYDALVCRTRISVRTGPLFTIVRVNGLDVYFHRLTGKIDGVGFTQSADRTPASDLQAIGSEAPPADLPRPHQTENPPVHSK